MKRRIVLILVVVLVLGGIAGGIWWYIRQQTGPRLLFRADTEFKAGNFDEAARLAGSYVAESPRDWRGHYVLGKAHKGRAAYDEARKALTIAGELMDLGLRVSILSRGYMRKSKGTVVVSDGEGMVATVEQAGEEAFMLARLLKKAVVIVDKNRFRAGCFAEDEFSVDVHILDDGFQHLPLYRDLDVVCLPASFPSSHGRLREPVSTLKYADVVVFTGKGKASTIDQWTSYLQIIHPKVTAVHLPILFKGFYSAESRPIDHSWVLANRWCALSGIARPHRFFRELTELNVPIAGVFTFPDHHWPSESEFQEVADFVRDKKLKGIVTTDKDIHKWLSLPVEKIVMRVGFPPLPNVLLKLLKETASS